MASRFSPVIESQSAMTVHPVSAQQRSALATQLAARAPLIQPLAPPPAAAPVPVAAPPVAAPPVTAPQVTAPQVTAPPVNAAPVTAPPQVSAPQPAAAAADPAPRGVQLAARPDPQAAPQAVEEKQAEQQPDEHSNKRHSRRYRRAEPSLLASLGVTTQQTRRTRHSSQPTNLLSFLKKAITPDSRTRRRR